MSVHQNLMDRAYYRWNGEWKGLGYDEFVNRLDYAERLAVLTGNLNYQVENGGWGQWFDNRYGDHARTLRSVLLPYVERDGAERPDIAEVIRIMDRAVITWNHLNDDDRWSDEFHTLDEAYYAINGTFMESMESILAAEVTNGTR